MVRVARARAIEDAAAPRFEDWQLFFAAAQLPGNQQDFVVATERGGRIAALAGDGQRAAIAALELDGRFILEA